MPSEKEQLTVSLGVATLDEDRKQLFKDADGALYTAKDTGRNRVVTADPGPRSPTPDTIPDTI